MVSLGTSPQESFKLCPSLNSSYQVILPPSEASLGKPSPYPPALPLWGLGAELVAALDPLGHLGALFEWLHEPHGL